MLTYGIILFLAIVASISVSGTIIHLVSQNKNLKVVECSLSLTYHIQIISKSHSFSSSPGLLPTISQDIIIICTTAVASSILLTLLVSAVAPNSFISTQLSVILFKDKADYILSLFFIFQCLPILSIKFKSLSRLLSLRKIQPLATTLT